MRCKPPSNLRPRGSTPKSSICARCGPWIPRPIVESVRKTNRIVAVEEGWPVCGICSEIAAVLMEQAFDDLDAPMVRVTGEDVPMPYAANLEALALPNPNKIVQAAKSVCYRD